MSTSEINMILINIQILLWCSKILNLSNFVLIYIFHDFKVIHWNISIAPIRSPFLTCFALINPLSQWESFCTCLHNKWKALTLTRYIQQAHVIVPRQCQNLGPIFFFRQPYTLYHLFLNVGLLVYLFFFFFKENLLLNVFAFPL